MPRALGSAPIVYTCPATSVPTPFALGFLLAARLDLSCPVVFLNPRLIPLAPAGVVFRPPRESLLTQRVPDLSRLLTPTGRGQIGLPGFARRCAHFEALRIETRRARQLNQLKRPARDLSEARRTLAGLVSRRCARKLDTGRVCASCAFFRVQDRIQPSLTGGIALRLVGVDLTCAARVHVRQVIGRGAVGQYENQVPHAFSSRPRIGPIGSPVKQPISNARCV